MFSPSSINNLFFYLENNPLWWRSWWWYGKYHSFSAPLSWCCWSKQGLSFVF